NSHGAGIAFSDSSTNNNVGAAVEFQRIGNASQGELKFLTKSSTNDGDGPTSVMTLTDSQQVLIGNSIANLSAALGTLDVRGDSGTQPIATFSGATSFAGLVVDNSGSGDLFTASSSGLPRFTIANNGNITDTT